jgi:hypothetical protein
VLSKFGQMQDTFFFFGMSIYYLLVGAEYLSSRHEPSDADISRIFQQIFLFSQYT